MKRQLFTLILIFFIIVRVYALENIESLLKNEDWKQRQVAIDLISKNIQDYKNNDLIKNMLLDLLSIENERLKFLLENKVINDQEGHGEYYIDLIDLIIKLNIYNSTQILLDCADLGNKIEDAIIDSILKEDEEDIRIFLNIKERFISNDIFYKGKRSSYLRIICKYLNNVDLKKKINKAKKGIIREIIINGLVSQSHIDREYSIRCSKYFADDAQIIDILIKISKTDEYKKKKNSTEYFPIREEALSILKEIKDNLD